MHSKASRMQKNAPRQDSSAQLSTQQPIVSDLRCMCQYLASYYALSHDCILLQVTTVHTQHKQLIVTIAAFKTQGAVQ